MMNIIDQLNLNKKISKSEINSKGNCAVVLFDKSSEFAIIDIANGKITLSYYHDLGYNILDCCFAPDTDTIWLACLNAVNQEWDYVNRKIVRSCGEVVKDDLDDDLSGYSCITVVAKHKLLIAANIGSYRLEFFDLTTLKHINSGALCEVYAKEIAIHPSQDIIALLITDTEDTCIIRFYSISNIKIKLYKKHITCYFAGSSCGFGKYGSQFVITGGYPPFSYQVHEFPSLAFINEFLDDGGLTIPQPWGNTKGITFNNDFIIEQQTNALLTPYFNGDISIIDIEEGKITNAIKCSSAVNVSLTYAPVNNYLLASSISGEITLFQSSAGTFKKLQADEYVHFNQDELSENLLLPLKDMEEVSSAEEPSLLVH